MLRISKYATWFSAAATTTTEKWKYLVVIKWNMHFNLGDMLISRYSPQWFAPESSSSSALEELERLCKLRTFWFVVSICHSLCRRVPASACISQCSDLYMLLLIFTSNSSCVWCECCQMEIWASHFTQPCILVLHLPSSFLAYARSDQPGYNNNHEQQTATTMTSHKSEKKKTTKTMERKILSNDRNLSVIYMKILNFSYKW